MSLGNSLRARGLTLSPWPRDKNLRSFVRFPFDGLLDLRACLMVISVNSVSPGSGQLGNLFERFEQSADEHRTFIVVAHIWNDRLHAWLKRRGYEMGENKMFGRFATRNSPALVAANPVDSASRSPTGGIAG